MSLGSAFVPSDAKVRGIATLDAIDVSVALVVVVVVGGSIISVAMIIIVTRSLALPRRLCPCPCPRHRYRCPLCCRRVNDNVKVIVPFIAFVVVVAAIVLSDEGDHDNHHLE